MPNNQPTTKTERKRWLATLEYRGWHGDRDALLPLLPEVTKRLIADVKRLQERVDRLLLDRESET